ADGPGTEGSATAGGWARSATGWALPGTCAAPDGPGRDRHPRAARRDAWVRRGPGQGQCGPAAAAPAAPGHAGAAGPGVRCQRVPGRGRGYRRGAAGAGQILRVSSFSAAAAPGPAAERVVASEPCASPGTSGA